MDAAIWIDPARMGGKPCLYGTRIDVDTVVNVVWHHGVQYFLDDYDSDSRRNVLACCVWWVQDCRLDSRDRAEVRHANAWAEWAFEAHQVLRDADAATAASIPDPPMKPASWHR
jgi:uncharacterized protein (DUF433 family)